MIRKLAPIALLLALVGGLVFWFVTAPQYLDPKDIAAVASGDVTRGQQIFWEGGCAACHAAVGSKDDERLKLVGGLVLPSPFGNFHVPNISQDAEDGIGTWDFASFANAVQRGVSPQGEHYYPSFPFSSYSRMKLADVSDLYAFMKTLPAVKGKQPGHELPFPFNIRRLLGGWKFLFFKPHPVATLAADASDQAKRGQYLVEGPGHCGECHTPRNLLGSSTLSKWLSGGPNPEGKGVIPNITGGEGGLDSWSDAQIASLLKDGFNPDFDSVGGSMTAVVANWSHVSDEDRLAVAAYLKAVPKLADSYTKPAN